MWHLIEIERVSFIIGMDLPELTAMINAAHLVLYSKNPEADRKFFNDVLQFPAVDVGGGWLSPCPLAKPASTLAPTAHSGTLIMTCSEPFSIFDI
jgi:hypothetical protein